jgi:hypothetical protein
MRINKHAIPTAVAESVISLNETAGNLMRRNKAGIKGITAYKNIDINKFFKSRVIKKSSIIFILLNVSH